MNLLEKIKIENVLQKDIYEIQKLVKNLYPLKKFNGQNLHLHYNLTELLFKDYYVSTHDKSIKVVYRKKIIGVMLLSDFSFYWLLEAYKEDDKNISKNIRKYKNKEGLRSVFFGIDIKYQKMGIGSKMIEYVRENYKQFDFLWGVQHKDISNLDFFLKRRKVVAEIEDGIYTVQDLK